MTPPTIRFSFDGRPLQASPGASVASALVANGLRSWRRTRTLGAARGLLCGIGTCFDCLVDVGTQRAVRACVTALRDGDSVRTSASRGSGGTDPCPPAPAGTAADVLRGAVLVVGGGPAGLAAADAAVGCGVSVVLVDSAARLGGQLLRQPSLDATGDVRPLSRGLAVRYPRLAHAPGVTVATGTGIWQLRAGGGGVVGWLEDGRRIETTAMVLASGATELVAPFPGWDLPGVVSAGAAQTFIKAHGELVGRRVLVAGSGPFLFPVAASLARTGAKVVSVVEALSARRLASLAGALARHPAKATEAAAYVTAVVRHGVPVRTGRVVARCEPGRDGTVGKAVVVPNREADGAGGRQDRRAHVYDVDAVCTSFGFVPRLELARQLGLAEEVRPGQLFSAVACDVTQATSVAGVFAAGEVTGIEGGEVAALEGTVAGAAAAAYCLGRDPRDGESGGGRLDASRDRRMVMARNFAACLNRAYPIAVPLGLIGDETVVCRCEDVRAGAIRSAFATGAASAREVRNATRCGMGYCQGRTCGPLVQLMTAASFPASASLVGDLQQRPVAIPVALQAVARGSRTIGDRSGGTGS